MGLRTPRVEPLLHPSQVRTSDVNNVEDQKAAAPPGPVISYAQLQRELHRQATQRKPGSQLSSSSSSSAARSSPPSQYSVSKLEAFDDFHNRTSLIHAIAILLATPIPCLAIMLALESILLVHPSLRWEANYMYFVRMFFSMLAIAMSVAIEYQEFIPETLLTWTQLGVIIFCQAITFVSTLIGVSAAAGVFPVLYSLLIAIGPAISAACFVQYMLARLRIPIIPDFAAWYRNLFAIRLCEVLAIMVYPAYATVFLHLSSRDQVWFSLLLPVVKYVFRVLLLRKMEAQMDVVGMMSASGHLFHVLFTVTCLQNAKTHATVGFILAWDIANAVRNCFKMVYYAKKNLALQRATPSARSVPTAGVGSLLVEESCHTTNHENVAKRALTLAEHPKVLARLLRSDPSVLVSSYHRYSHPKWIAKHQELLRKQQQPRQKNSASCKAGRFTFQRSGGAAASDRARRVSAAIRLFLRKIPAEVLLNSRLDVVPRKSLASVATSNSPVSEALNAEEVQDTLTILHANEICLLHSYMSGMVYLVYGESQNLRARRVLAAQLRVRHGDDARDDRAGGAENAADHLHPLQRGAADRDHVLCRHPVDAVHAQPPVAGVHLALAAVDRAAKADHGDDRHLHVPHPAHGRRPLV